MERDAFISEIEVNASRVGWLPSTICARAVNNGHLYRRLKDGGDCSSRTMERVRRFMAGIPTKDANAPSEDAA